MNTEIGPERGDRVSEKNRFLDAGSLESFLTDNGRVTGKISEKKGLPSPKVLFVRRETKQLDPRKKEIGEKADKKKKRIDELVDRFQAGEIIVERELFKNLAPVVKNYVRAKYKANYSITADDIEQNTLLAVHKQLPHYKRQENKPFLAFVYGIASHKVNDALREMRKEKSDLADQLPEDAKLLGISFKDSVEDQVIGKTAAEQLINRLTAKERKILDLRLLQGFSAEEVSEMMNMPSAGAVRIAQNRAINKLKHVVTDEDYNVISKQEKRPKEKKSEVVKPHVEPSLVLHLREKGLSYREISEELDIPFGSIGYRLNQARNQKERDSMD